MSKYCRPLCAGLQSSERAVAARLSRLLTSLDNEVTGNVCEGTIVACVSALKRDMLLSLRAEGWRVSYVDGGERWKVLPPARPRRKRTDRTAYRWFRIHGHTAESALQLARAESYADAHDWTVMWEQDEGGDLDDHAAWCAEAKRAEHADETPGCTHEILCAALKSADGDVLASLGAIIDPSRDYGRVIEAELALEAMPTPRRRKRTA